MFGEKNRLFSFWTAPAGVSIYMTTPNIRMFFKLHRRNILRLCEHVGAENFQPLQKLRTKRRINDASNSIPQATDRKAACRGGEVVRACISIAVIQAAVPGVS